MLPNPANPTEQLFREWNGGFWIDGPQDDVQYEGDTDKDGMPDDWERRCNLIVGEDDSTGDKDLDGLPNIDELKQVPHRAGPTRIAEASRMEAKSKGNVIHSWQAMTGLSRSKALHSAR